MFTHELFHCYFVVVTLWFSLLCTVWKNWMKDCISGALCPRFRFSWTAKPPIPLSARSKAWVCGCSLAGIVGSNPSLGVDVCLLWVLCVARLRSLRRAGRSSRGVLPSVVWCTKNGMNSTTIMYSCFILVVNEICSLLVFRSVRLEFCQSSVIFCSSRERQQYRES